MATLTTITIRDIAAACHASTASVSRALNGKPGVSDGLKATIIAYASAHGYVPDSNARSMRLGQSTHIYLINRVENTDSSRHSRRMVCEIPCRQRIERGYLPHSLFA